MMKKKTAKQDRHFGELCFLCGTLIGQHEGDEDHVIPRLLLKQAQPLRPGYYYGGVLSTHKKCNRRFGDNNANAEAKMMKALRLLRLIYDPQYREINYFTRMPIMRIPPDAVKGFTKKELQFFGFSSNQLRMVNPFIRPTNIALSVLAKSSAALLVAEQVIPIRSEWNIFAITKHTLDVRVPITEDMGIILRVLEDETIVVGMDENKTPWVFWQLEGYIVVMYFLGIGSSTPKILQVRWSNFESFEFRGQQLTDLVDYDWIKQNVFLPSWSPR